MQDLSTAIKLIGVTIDQRDYQYAERLAHVLTTLARYARCISFAKEYEAKGNAERSQQWLTEADRVYTVLPEEDKWL